jgi:hypothetical protein
MDSNQVWDVEASHFDTPGAGMFAPDVLGAGCRSPGDLETRRGDWRGAEFTAESGSQVSVYPVRGD